MTMYKIKQISSDFIVKENIELELKELGYFGYFLLKKVNLTTKEAIENLANFLGIKINRISYSGLKDKNAETFQYISIYKPYLNKINKINPNNFEVKFAGMGNKPIFLGQLESNDFIITVRDLDHKYKKINFVENYFDEQRFSRNNVEIGRYMVKKEYGKVMKLLGFKESGLNQVNRLDKNKLKFYINSYQSYLWNSAVAKILSNNKDTFKLKYSLGEFTFLKNKVKNFSVPILNFDTEFNTKSIEEAYNKVIETEGISKDSFLIRQIPELINESVERDVFVNVKIESRFNEDDLNKEKFKQIIEFTLPKGSYGTILIKKMFL